MVGKGLYRVDQRDPGPAAVQGASSAPLAGRPGILRPPAARYRRAQADLAREYGITGFCYYHYWFTGRRLLERPFHEVLVSGEPDFPFCLCGANENWTRTWDGLDRNLLIDQSYSAEDDLAHIRWLCETFRDPRYIRIEGRPLLLNRPRSSAELHSSSASTAGRPTWLMRSRLLESSYWGVT